MPDGTFAITPLPGVVFVPGAPTGVEVAMFGAPYQAFLKACAARGAWVVAVCVGAFILAAARLLDGCKATTYWSQISNLALLHGMQVQYAPRRPRR